MVAREYEHLKGTVPGFCGCASCRDDVMVFTLNRLSPRYVATPHGEVISKVGMERSQEQANVSMALVEALRRVHQAPRQGHSAPAER